MSKGIKEICNRSFPGLEIESLGTLLWPGLSCVCPGVTYARWLEVLRQPPDFHVSVFKP